MTRYATDVFSRVGATLGSYIELTKPRIMSLLLFTAIAGAALASEFELNANAFIATILGGMMAAGGASALNIALETDLDRRMKRTSERPVTSARVSRRNAILFGLTLNCGSFLTFLFLTNLLAASLALAGSALYVGLYTLILKRATWHNIVIGGAAGAVPPLVGYASVNGDLSLGAWYLFAIIFFWTPPHFWALALIIKDDYSKAQVPMLPVVKGRRATVVQIFLYVILLAGLTTAFAATPSIGWIYLIGSLILNAVFIVLALHLLRADGKKVALRLYIFSLLYLFVLFALVIVDARLHWLGLAPAL